MKLTRRRFLYSLPFVGGTALAIDGLLEPMLLRRTRLDLRSLGIGKKIVHFTDLHHKGNLAKSRRVIDRINATEPDYVFFTGDLVENHSPDFLDEALGLISEIEFPVFGILGNHDPVDSLSLGKFRAAFERTGGGFLTGDRIDLDGFVLHGSRNSQALPFKEPEKKILLCHYPAVGERALDQKYDLILCGHSHGGQIRLPLIGPLMLPPLVGPYDRGFFKTPAGNLFVNVGCGEFLVPFRLFCRPEITEITV